jgi:hypothetical protein
MRWNPTGDDSRQSIDEYEAETGHTEEAEWYRRSKYAWNPNDQDGTILRVSKSSLGTYGWCPQQYYIERFLHIQGPQTDDQTRGSNVHDFVEFFWADFNAEEEVMALYEAGKTDAARDLFYSHSTPTPPEPYEFGEEGQIQQWLEWQYQRLIHGGTKHWRPVAVEAHVHANRYVEVEDERIPVHLSGFIDSIFNTGHGTYALMELKSGKWGDKSSQYTKMRKEMAFYQMFLNHSPHSEYLPISHWGWEFPGGLPRGGVRNAVVYEGARDTSVRSVEKELQKLVAAHVNMDFPPDPWLGRPKEGVPLEEQLLKCNWCSFHEHCDFWSVTDHFLDTLEEEE